MVKEKKALPRGPASIVSRKKATGRACSPLHCFRRSKRLDKPRNELRKRLHSSEDRKVREILATVEVFFVEMGFSQKFAEDQNVLGDTASDGVERKQRLQPKRKAKELKVSYLEAGGSDAEGVQFCAVPERILRQVGTNAPEMRRPEINASRTQFQEPSHNVPFDAVAFAGSLNEQTEQFQDQRCLQNEDSFAGHGSTESREPDPTISWRSGEAAEQIFDVEGWLCNVLK